MAEIIRMGSLELRFLHGKQDTDGSVDMFEMTLRPEAQMPIPHSHESWDESIYELTGTSTWRVDGQEIDLPPGRSLFIRRGVVHNFWNRSAAEAVCLCVLTPGTLDPAYFREMAAIVAGGDPDRAAMKALMLSHGLVPAESN